MGSIKQKIVGNRRRIWSAWAAVVFCLVLVFSFARIPAARAIVSFPDTNKDRNVDIYDLAYLLAHWLDDTVNADFDQSGTVDIVDLSMLLNKWKDTGGYRETFSGFTADTCFDEDTTVADWLFVFDGFGCNQIKTDGTRQWLDQVPQASTSLGETHANLVVGPSATGDISFSADMITFEHVRQNDPANEWEVAWVVWNYTDNTHFYYFTLKPNGWELGKADPAYPGSQRFLASGSSPVYPIGSWYDVEVTQIGNTITASSGGQELAAFTDTEDPYTSGKIGLYNEDAHVGFTDVQLEAL